MVSALVTWALMPNHFRERSTGHRHRHSSIHGVKLCPSYFIRQNFWIVGPKRISLCWMPASLCLVPSSNINRKSFCYRKLGLNSSRHWRMVHDLRRSNSRPVRISTCATCLAHQISVVIQFQDARIGTISRPGNVCGFFTTSRRPSLRPMLQRRIAYSALVKVK